MGVYMQWKSACDRCQATGPVGRSQAGLLKSMRLAGWKCRRVSQGGFTRISVACPGCASKPFPPALAGSTKE
jgi:hypothetical protein